MRVVDERPPDDYGPELWWWIAEQHAPFAPMFPLSASGSRPEDRVPRSFRFDPYP